MSDEELPEDVSAQFGETGPVAASEKWLRLILEDGDLRAAWPLTDPRLRLVMAQAWIWANRNHVTIQPYDRDELARALATEKPTHPLWPGFEETQLGGVSRVSRLTVT